jgi:pilus assembly protein CpaB
VSRRRRGALLLGLALALGGLAASDVARREASMRAQLAPLVTVVTAGRDLEPGHALRASDLALRRVPARYAPVDAGAPPEELLGRKLAAAVPRGGYVGVGQIEREYVSAVAPVRRGERAVEVAGLAPADLIAAGARIDVLTIPERGASQVALEDVEVLGVRPAGSAEDTGAAGNSPRIAATLRVTVRQALYLASLETRPGVLRLLPRALGDHARIGTG